LLFFNIRKDGNDQILISIFTKSMTQFIKKFA